MSGYGTDTTEGGIGFAQFSSSPLGSELTNLLFAQQIVPGSPPSYQLCKNIFTFHPLGAKMAQSPIDVAQSQEREITVPNAPERLVDAFKREWRALGKIGADALIRNTMTLSRVYGIASLVIGDRKTKAGAPLEFDKLADADPFFNILDPLNTAGSLVLDQDPNSPDFQRPRSISVAGQEWHPSRCCVMMNEQPVYIEWSNSAFGFVGRSCYQRALFPLKSYIQSLITDDMVTKKIGLLVWKAKSPTSAINNRVMAMFGWKRAQLKDGVTGQVLQIGETEDVASLNFQNLEGAGKFTRDNILKNIATADGMPAVMLDQETFARGMAEGTEDAKTVARYIDRKRMEMQPIYTFCDRIVQHRAWSPAFYKSIQAEHAEYQNVPYQTAFYQWQNTFEARWPNLLVEPDSEKTKTDEVKFKSAVAIFEVLAPKLDPENLTALDEINGRKELFSSPLVLDLDALREWQPKEPPPPPGEPGEPDEPPPFSGRS